MTAKDLLRPMAIATGMGTVAVLIVWAIASALSVDFTVSTLGMPIPVAGFVIFSIVGGIGAWIVSSLLLKTKKPRENGQIIGWLVLLGSIATPLSGTADFLDSGNPLCNRRATADCNGEALTGRSLVANLIPQLNKP